MNNVERMEGIIVSVTSSLKENNYFAALTNSLIIIDTCSKIYLPNENKNNKRYKKWIDDFLIEELKEHPDYLSSNNIWFLRNAMLHQGSANPTTNSQYQKHGDVKVRDIVPTIFPKNEISNVIIVDQGGEYPTLFFDIHYFCNSILKVVSEWTNKNIDLVKQSNIHLFSIAYALSSEDNITILRF